MFCIVEILYGLIVGVFRSFKFEVLEFKKNEWYNFDAITVFFFGYIQHRFFLDFTLKYYIVLETSPFVYKNYGIDYPNYVGNTIEMPCVFAIHVYFDDMPAAFWSQTQLMGFILFLQNVNSFL